MDHRRRRRHGSYGRDPRRGGLQYDVLNPRDDEIRVLHIRLDQARRAKYRLETISLRRSPRYRYTALSYTWGPPPGHDAESLRINGRYVNISHNLSRAIDQLCDHWFQSDNFREPLRIWIDQICIDQLDEAEKAQQLRLMDLIYERAQTVFILLPVRRSLDYRQRPEEMSTWNRYDRWHRKHMSWEAARNSGAKYMYTRRRTQCTVDAWENVNRIVNCKWWSRAWVFQEFVLAGRAVFLIDGFAVQWQELNNFLRPFFDARATCIRHCQDAFDYLDRTLRQPIQRRHRCLFRFGFASLGMATLEKMINSHTVIRKLLSRLESSHSQWELAEDMLQSKADRDGLVDLEPLMRLSTLMSHSRKRQSQWDRDKVYSILGLADPEGELDIPIEYPSDEDTLREADVDLLVKTATSIMYSEQRLDILAIPSPAQWDPTDQPIRGSHFPHVLPSWAPDWFLPLEDLDRPDQHNFSLWEHGLPGYRSSRRHLNLGNAGGDLEPVFSFPIIRHRARTIRALRVRALYAYTLGHMVKDLEETGWTRHVAYRNYSRTDVEIETSDKAQPSDQVWVILGCGKPLTLRHTDRSGHYWCILGPAVVRSRLTEALKTIHAGSLVWSYQQGRIQHRDILLV